MKTKLIYISIISLLFILQACKPSVPDCGDLSDVITNYNIPDSNKAKIPYIGKDTLVFISDAGDTATLIGQGKNTHYESVRSNISGGDCPRTGITNYENVEYNFKNTLLLLKLNIDESQPINKISYTSLSFYINDRKTTERTYEFIINSATQNDSIKIFNRYFTGKYIDLNNTLLFSFEIGILKFKDINNKIWILNTKK
jgi:hypothetical protein